MTLTAVRVPPGEALSWLAETVANLRDDPLRPVTVLAWRRAEATSLRRRLAARGPIANLRVDVPLQLATTLGMPGLAAAGKRPLRAPFADAMARVVLRQGATAISTLTSPVAARSTRRLLADCRRAGMNPSHLRAEPDLGPRLADVFAAWERLRADHDRYDDVDLVLAASQAVTAGCDLDDVGAVVVHLPDHLDPPLLTLLRSLGTRTEVVVGVADLDGDDDATDPGRVLDLPAQTRPKTPLAPTSVLVAADAVAEVGDALRWLVARAERAPAERLGIAYLDEDTYRPLIVDALEMAQLPFSIVGGRPLGETHAGRAMRALVGLVGGDLSRADVLDFLASAPRHGRGEVPVHVWERLTQRAGVTRGAARWETALQRLANELRRDLASLDEDAPRAAVERQLASLDRIRQTVAALDAALRPPSPAPWTAWARWLVGLRRAFVPTRAWGPDEEEAAARLDHELSALAECAEVEGTAVLEDVVATLEDRLERCRVPIGRLGRGIAVGRLRDLARLGLDRLAVVGVLEGAIPSAPPSDPLLPTSDGHDPLHRRARRRREERLAWELACSAPREVLVAAPQWDAQRRPVHPSPWLADLVSRVEGRAVSTSELRSRPVGLQHLVPTPEPAPPCLDLAEVRLREAKRTVAEGTSLLASPIAERLPALRRVVLVRRSRRSHRLTEFDGNLESAADHPWLVAGLCAPQGPPHSPTRVERWASCPFQYLLSVLLRVAPTERPRSDDEWRLDPRRRGAIVHDILCRYFRDRERGAIEGAAVAKVDLDHLEKVADEVFAEAEERGWSSHPLIWDAEKVRLVRDIRALVESDARCRAGMVPFAFEQRFGFGDADWPPLEVRLDASRTVRFRGVVDRIDVAPSPAAITKVEVIDYKSGTPAKAASTNDPLQAGTRLQGVVYALAVEQALRARGHEVAQATARYWYLGSPQPQDEVDALAQTSRLVSVLDVVDAAIRCGAFPQIPGEEGTPPWRPAGTWKNCSTCDYDRICPSSRDVVAERKASSPLVGLHRRLRSEGAAAAIEDGGDLDE